MSRIDVLGIEFDDVTPAEALDAVWRIILDDGYGYAVTPNPEFIYACHKNPSLTVLLNSAAISIPDGIGVIYASRILGRPLKSRVPGIELAEGLMKRMAKEKKRLYFLGAKPGVAEKAARRLEKEYPGLVIAGARDGYYKDADEDCVVAAMAEAKPDAAFVCMGFPRQESFMLRRQRDTGVKLMIGLGGSLDVFAGDVKRAPEMFRKLGLEWLYRLIKEPKRIIRMIKLPVFLFIAVGKIIRYGRSK